MSISEDNNNNSNNDSDTNIEEKSASIEESPEGQEAIETDNLEKMILSTGIRVGTPVKTEQILQRLPLLLPENTARLRSKSSATLQAQPPFWAASCLVRLPTRRFQTIWSQK
jgi:hypothetical protein